jgi:hypothetical protein
MLASFLGVLPILTPVEGVNSSRIYLIYCKNFCKCHSVSPPSTAIKKIKGRQRKCVQVLTCSFCNHCIYLYGHSICMPVVPIHIFYVCIVFRKKNVGQRGQTSSYQINSGHPCSMITVVIILHCILEIY